MPQTPEATYSRNPERKRAYVFNNLNESMLENRHSVVPGRWPISLATPNKPNCQSLGGNKGVLLGTWRDSDVPSDDKKHAVIGFIDRMERLRLYIQPNTKYGESLTELYPLPPGPGRCWAAFERVILSDHLVGLDYLQVKEYTRLRSEAVPEGTEGEPVAAELAAVQDAIRSVKEDSASGNPAQPPVLAYGISATISEHSQDRVGPEPKRRRVSGGFAAVDPAPSELGPEPVAIPTSPQSIAAHDTRFLINPYPGTRPTHIFIGYWKTSSEIDPNNRHAVYGIVRQDDKFCVEIVRETTDGRLVGGNLPSGPAVVLIPYEEIEFEPHLKALHRDEIKEYCLVRQSQLGRGETSAERIGNETKAVYEAQIRAGIIMYQQSHNITFPMSTASPQSTCGDRVNGRHGYGGYDLFQSHRTETQPIRPLVNKNELHPNRIQNIEAVKRTNTLARCEILKAEAAQGPADRRAVDREHASAAGTATAASNNVQQLSKIGARQEALRIKSGLDDAKINGHIKYERKATGTFMGQFVSQGTIIHIDGEDYVEYRILTKPSFF